MRPFRKACILVLDGAGVGALPDCGEFGDPATVDTLGNCSRAVGGFDAPNLTALGFGILTAIQGVPPPPPGTSPAGFVLKMAERSNGKDTPTGHWEMMGIDTREPFATFSPGFPPEILAEFKARTGYDVLGNCVASGTAILDDLGAEHIRTGLPIVYTSADSVFQVAAHEAVISIERLWEICATARAILDPWRVGRVIARPFVGQPGAWQRTYNRRDFSMPPPPGTLLDRMVAAGLPVIGVGKIHDIFAGCGVSENVHSEGNTDGLALTLDACRRLERGLVFTNLVDFDALYGHRRNPAGFAAALREADAALPGLLDALGPDGLLILTADHGNDTTHLASTDHTREYVPCVFASRRFAHGADLGTADSFAALGQTLAENFGLAPLALGRSCFGALAAGVMADNVVANTAETMPG
ncbi:MAG: phosphopentomutase [Myxococcales bacterium]|nr:phosphopentomutase [Myxococcales bacterium]